MAAPDQLSKITIPLATREPSIHGPRTVASAFIESLNGKFRAECLNAHWFMTLADAAALVPFSCRIDVVETKGRKVTKLRLSWWTKTVAERKVQWEAQQDKQRDLFDVDLPEMEVWEPS